MVCRALGMTVQDDNTLKLITAKNRLFGTIGLTTQAVDSDYKSNLTLKVGQIPSTYFFSSALFENTSTRYRPFHSQGFIATSSEMRMYWVLAGYWNTIGNLRSALSTDFAPINPSLPDTKASIPAFYESRYFVYAPIGVDKTGVEASIRMMQKQATPLSTDALVTMNRDDKGGDKTATYYIKEGALQGMFWASKQGGWNSGSGQNTNRLFPFEIIDYPIPDTAFPEAAARGSDFPEALKVVPADNRVHFGHSLMTIDAIETYYKDPNMQVGLDNVITGADLWTRMLRLGAYAQSLGYSANARPFGAQHIQSGTNYLSLKEAGDLNRQKQLVTELIANFVDN
jgi:hypothetical protein